MADGARTRDRRHHKPELYQLSYCHRAATKIACRGLLARAGDRSAGARARRDADMLVQKWKDEDAAAGRMTAADYVALRYRLGYVDVVR